MNFKELLEKHTKDGEINYEDAEASFQSQVNGIVKKNVKKEIGKKETELVSNFITELGIEASDIEGVKKWASTINDSSTDFQKQSVTLQKELDDALKSNTTISKDYTNFKQDTLISGLGFDSTTTKGKEKAEFLKYKFNNNVSDDVTFESQIDNYKKENREDTYRPLNNNFEQTQTSEPLEALKKLREKN